MTIIVMVKVPHGTPPSAITRGKVPTQPSLIWTTARFKPNRMASSESERLLGINPLNRLWKASFVFWVKHRRTQYISSGADSTLSTGLMISTISGGSRFVGGVVIATPPVLHRHQLPSPDGQLVWSGGVEW